MWVKVCCCILAFMVVFALGAWASQALGWFAPKDATGTVANVGNVRRLISQSSEYLEGEPIMITAWSCTDTDQIVLYSLDGNLAVRWCRVGKQYAGNSVLTAGNGSGVPVDMSSRNVPGAAKNSAWKDIPAGEYVCYLADEAGAVRYCEVSITILSAE